MATIDEELGQLERDILSFKIEYDQYSAAAERPPRIDGASISW